MQSAFVVWIKTILAEGGIKAFFLKLAAQVALSIVVNKLFGPKVPRGALSGHQVMTRSALEYRKIVYGEAQLSGPVVYNNTSGGDLEYLWYVIALAQGESEDLVSVWFDGDEIPKADIDWTAGSGGSDGTGTGDVSTAKWIGEDGVQAVQIFYYLGDPNQPVCGALNTAFADIDSAHRLRGVTYLVVRLMYNKKTARIWQAGPPNNIKAVIKGLKVYDPRLDSTNGGSGSHRYATPSTWAWSDNPALCKADYQISIIGIDPAASINWPSVANAADDCDVLVAIPPAGSPQSTEKRFTCNGVLSMGDSHKDNVSSILSSMDGKESYSSGVWKTRASVWDASSLTITADDLAGPIQIRGSSPRSDRFNSVRGFFVDPTRLHEPVEFPRVIDSAFVARDKDEVISRDLQLPMTNTETMAQRIGYRNLEQSDNQIVVDLTMNARGAKVTAGDVVTLEFPWLDWTIGADLLSKEDGDFILLESSGFLLLESSTETLKARCIEWARNPDGTYKVTLREDKELSYTDPIVADYGLTAAAGITYPGDVTPAPSGLTATSVPSGIQLAWDNPPPNTYDFIGVYEGTSNDWTASPEQHSRVALTDSDTITLPHESGEIYFYWIRAIRVPDLLSNRYPDSDITTIAATSGLDGGVTPSGVVTAIGVTVTNVTIDPATALAGYRVDSDGDVYKREGSGGSWVSIGTWLNSGSAGDYGVYMEDLGTGSDTPTGSAVDTWLDAGSDQTWELADTSTAGVLKDFHGIVKFRDNTISPLTSEVLSSASASLQARMLSGA